MGKFVLAFKLPPSLEELFKELASQCFLELNIEPNPDGWRFPISEPRVFTPSKLREAKFALERVGRHGTAPRAGLALQLPGGSDTLYLHAAGDEVARFVDLFKPSGFGAPEERADVLRCPIAVGLQGERRLCLGFMTDIKLPEAATLNTVAIYELGDDGRHQAEGWSCRFRR